MMKLVTFFVLLLSISTFTYTEIGMSFQETPGEIQWKTHFKSPPEKVYAALADAKQRKGYWADSVEENNGTLTYVFNNLGFTDKGRILEAVPNKKFSVTYLSTKVTFELQLDEHGGTDMTLSVKDVPKAKKTELIAGWVNWLMTMKGAVDFGIDLRNHDPKRTWKQGYVEN